MAKLKPGSVVGGDYKIVRELAKGGYGAVFVAEQLSTGRQRALKVMLPQLVDGAKARERFQREARIGASIPSTHVVEVLASGIDEETDTPWLVMELLAGETLAARLDRVHRLAPADVLGVLEDAGHALAAAHARGIFHLDLKPENLFIARTQSRRGDEETVKVLDFGIARIAAETRHSATVTTGVGSVLWMAPEQAAKGFKVSAASDVWSLGLLAFRMLTGKYYWEAANVDPGEDIPSTAVLVEVTAMPLVPASERARALGADTALLPAGFDAWFARCVNRDASQRFHEAGEAVGALRAVLGGAATTVSSATAPLPGVPVAPRGVEASPRTEPVAVPFAGHAPVPVRTVPPGVSSEPRRALWPFVAAGVAALGLAAVGIASSFGGGTSRDAGVADAAVARVTVIDAGPPPPRCPEGMVLLPAGRFMMGSPEGTGEASEHPRHEVVVPSPFCIDRTEVTVAAYRACRDAGACASDPNAYSSERGSGINFCNWGRAGNEQHPVNCVDWNQARAFCAWRGHAGGARRLPTEAEWEYAARGSAGRIYAWGDTLEAGRANFCGTECVAGASALGHRGWTPFPNWTDAFAFTAPVGSFPTGNTPEGVADLTGNVWEWVEDVYNPTAYGTRERGFNARVAVTQTASEFTEQRVLRGGSWSNFEPSWVRASYRNWGTRSIRNGFVGFRCARDL